MKKTGLTKSIMAGILAGVITVGIIPATAAGIEAVMNSVNISVNGKKAASVNETYTLQNGTKVPYSILYEGTTYLPVRKISELLNIGVDWDNDTRTVLIDSTKKQNQDETVVPTAYDAWYNAPDFGTVNNIKEIDKTITMRSTTHWYERKTVTSDKTYIEALEAAGFERITEGDVKPKFKVYKKGDVEVWLDLGMYTDLVYGVTIVDTTRPIIGKPYKYSGAHDDIPDFSSAFGYYSTIIGGIEYFNGDWHMWASLPEYFQLLESEGFRLSSLDRNYYGKSATFKKDRSSVVVKFDGSEYSNIPAVSIDYK